MRELRTIGLEIQKTWPRINDAAAPYVVAMKNMGTTDLNERYACSDGRGIVTRFLCNAQTWRGADARRIKTELKAMLKT